MRLRYFLILIFLVLALIPAAFFRAWHNTADLDTQMVALHERHLFLARNLAATLDRYHRDVSNSFELMTTTPAVWAVSDRAATTLNALGFRHLCIAEIDTGRVLHDIAIPNVPCPDVVPSKALKRFRAEATSSITFSEVTQSPDGETVLFVLSLLPNDQIAIGSLRTTFFIELGQAFSFGKGGYAGIVDQAGNVLFHPATDWITDRKNIVDVSTVKQLLNGETNVETAFPTTLKGDMVSGFAGVRPVGWGVLILMPLEELYERASFARNKAAVFLVLGLAGAVVLAMFVSVITARPLEEISKAARRIAEGELHGPYDKKTSHFLPREFRELHSSFRDMVIRLRQSIAQINTLAFVDSMTQLANREAFRRRLVAQIENAGEGDFGTLLFIDLDGFKAINDTKGHDAGDAVLVEVASRLCTLLDIPHNKEPTEVNMISRESKLFDPIVARLGGDEFAVFLPGKTMDDATEFADAALLSLSLPIAIGSLNTRVGASIGAASFPDHGTTFSDLLKAADLAMYEAKRAGKNQVRHYTPELTKSHDTLIRLAPELAEGFAQGQFDVHFQPIYDTQSFAMTSIESLIRWHHPTLGILEADHFLESAVKFGFQRQIDLFAFEQSLAVLEDLALHGVKPPALSINMWAECLLDEEFVDSVLRALPRFPCPLSFELITSSAPPDARFVWAVDRLREAGVGIELDDFGSATTSFAALTDFRPTAIKIDGKLTSRIHENSRGTKLVASIISMAQSQGISVTVEGVETLDQVKKLQQLGCENIQGYALNSPMTRNELLVCLSSAPFGVLQLPKDQVGTN